MIQRIFNRFSPKEEYDFRPSSNLPWISLGRTHLFKWFQEKKFPMDSWNLQSNKFLWVHDLYIGIYSLTNFLFLTQNVCAVPNTYTQSLYKSTLVHGTRAHLRGWIGEVFVCVWYLSIVCMVHTLTIKGIGSSHDENFIGLI